MSYGIYQDINQVQQYSQNMNDQANFINRLTGEQIKEQVQKLGKWFLNINLNGVNTAPDHFLGDYPNVKFKNFAGAIRNNLSSKSVS